MFRERKPSLRHFAVLRRELRSLRGSIWEVKDRRNPLRKQYLFVPSRLNSWPIWLSRLESIEPTPARLRNGKVVLLLSSPDVGSILDILRRRTSGSEMELNALTGFQLGRSKRKRLQLALVPVMALVASVLLLIPREESLATQTVEPSNLKPAIEVCDSPVQTGFEFSGEVSRYQLIDIAGQKFKIADIKKLGGLTQIKAKRLCDKQYFRFDAWLHAKELRVERVY